MLIPFENESLYSFILRGLIISGNTKFDSVIGINGLWLEKPHVPRESQYLFCQLDDSQLFEISKKSGLANENRFMFGNPSSFIHSLKYIYAQKNTIPRKVKGSIEIKFCIYCIKESIILNGCGYFKADWLFSDDCSKHNRSLQAIHFASYCGVKSEILKIFSGECNAQSFTNSKTKQFTRIKRKRDDNKDSCRIKLNNHWIYIMPCLKNDMSRWLAINTDNLYESITSMRDFLIRDTICSSTEKYVHMDDDKWYMHLYHLIKYEEPFFKDYIDNNFKSSSYYFGMNRQNSFCETLYKLTGSDCSKCLILASDEEPCPLNCNISHCSYDEFAPQGVVA